MHLDFSRPPAVQHYRPVIPAELHYQSWQSICIRAHSPWDPPHNSSPSLLSECSAGCLKYRDIKNTRSSSCVCRQMFLLFLFLLSSDRCQTTTRNAVMEQVFNCCFIWSIWLVMNDSIIVLGVWTGRWSSLSLPAKPKSDTVGSFKFVHYKNGGGKMYSLFGSFLPQLVQHLQFKRKNCNLITSGYG